MAAAKQVLWKLLGWSPSITGLVWQLHFIMQYTRNSFTTKIILEVLEVYHFPSLYLRERHRFSDCSKLIDTNVTITGFYVTVPLISSAAILSSTQRQCLNSHIGTVQQLPISP